MFYGMQWLTTIFSNTLFLHVILLFGNYLDVMELAFSHTFMTWFPWIFVAKEEFFPT
jgi:hypothetical protein